jgi:CubicO group peptidase (beta-lactamase class C family)
MHINRKQHAFVVGCTLVAAVASASDLLPRADPASRDVDPIALEAAFDAARALSGLDAVVVVRDGRVVGEAERFNGLSETHHIRSVTKSVTSLLVGIAIDRGFIGSVDDRMVDYLPAGLNPSDPDADAITLRHLLTHTSGFQWNEDAEWYVWVNNSDPARFILNRPVITAPGSSPVYSTAAVHVLSVVLSEATGMDTEAFAAEVLFQPLGITEYPWGRDRKGRAFGGHGLQLTTEDMAKLGLVLQGHGLYHGTSVVSGEWVRESSAVQVPLGGSFGPLSEIDYGLLWWRNGQNPDTAIIAWGWGGQFSVVVPSLNLVVAVSSRWNVPLATANRQEAEALELIFDHILPAVGHRGIEPRRGGRRLDVGPSMKWFSGLESRGAGPATVPSGVAIDRQRRD